MKPHSVIAIIAASSLALVALVLGLPIGIPILAIIAILVLLISRSMAAKDARDQWLEAARRHDEEDQAAQEVFFIDVGEERKKNGQMSPRSCGQYLGS